MKLKLLLSQTTAQFYMTTKYIKGATLRFQKNHGNKGFYIGQKIHGEYKHLNAPLKKL